MATKNIYFIGIGGIGISALARYYKQLGYKIYGTDMSNSALIESLKTEGMNIIVGQEIGEDISRFSKIIYTEAIPLTHEEIVQASKANIPCLSYPKALAEVVNKHKLIAIAGTHGKSTTTSLSSLVFKKSEEKFSALVGSVLKEFSGKNFYSNAICSQEESTPDESYFIIEACEYKRSFLEYSPHVGVIINIELDHLDYYKDLEDYLSAYRDFIENIHSGGFAILNGEDTNCKELLGLRDDINYIEVYPGRYKIYNTGEEYYFNTFDLQIPGSHIKFDAHIAYTIGLMAGIDEISIIEALEDYTGIWRRMEYVGNTQNGNMLLSDYGHHPTEILLTLGALKEKYPDKMLYTVFQPHQYNRTIELLDDFKTCFGNTDFLVIPDIYESRDSDDDKSSMNAEKFVDAIEHSCISHGNGLDNTLKLINDFDTNNSNAIILLLGAGNVDNLRYKITLPPKKEA